MEQAEELLHCVLERRACQQDLVLLKDKRREGGQDYSNSN